MYIIAIIAGVVAGITFYYIAARWIVYSVLRAEERHPHLAGSKALRVGEIVASSALVLACAAVAIWVARLLLER